MNVLLIPFMLVAAVGLALSVAAHCMSLAGIAIPGGGLVWALHVGIFIVWIPAVLVSLRSSRQMNRKDFWKTALAGCPVWMRRSFYGLFIYAIINFAIFMATTVNQPKPQMGPAPPSVIRGFSGHWMVFYGAAFVLLYSRINAPALFRERKCPNGHLVSHSACFCPECGYAFSMPRQDA
jgi:hypothetical protein